MRNVEVVEQKKNISFDFKLKCSCGFSWQEGGTNKDLQIGIASCCPKCNQKIDIEFKNGVVWANEIRIHK